jgi:hypothetical protein
MTPVSVLGDYRAAVAATAKALEELAARCDEIDAIGGLAALEAHVNANASALGFTYEQLSGSVATSGNFRNVLRNTLAEFPVGSRTNLYLVRT